MRYVETKELSATSMNELLMAIQKELEQCMDTQVFISALLFNRLLKKSRNSIVWEETVRDSFHYCDGIEKAFIFYMKSKAEIKTFQLHLVENNLDYLQLTFYATKGILYWHNLREMKVVLIIDTD